MTDREIPQEVRRELERQESQEFYLVFLTVRHPSIYDVIRVVSDPKNFILDGEEYIGFMFNIELLTDSERMPRASLTMQNVDKRIGEAVLRAKGAPRVTIEVIAGSQFDLTVDPRVALVESETPERVYSAKSLYLTEVECNVMELTGTLRSWDYTQEEWPATRVTQNKFPGLFR